MRRAENERRSQRGGLDRLHRADRIPPAIALSNSFIVAPAPHCALALGAGIGFIICDRDRPAAGSLPRFKEFLPGRRKVASLNRGWVCVRRSRFHAKILLAEDDNDMRRFLVKALQNAGYAVASFDNGISAYNRLREEPFELLLTDIVMPEMDGIELARRATELDPEIKVMFITGFAAVALNPDNNAPKDARILSKPFHLRELVTEVERLLKAA